MLFRSKRKLPPTLDIGGYPLPLKDLTRHMLVLGQPGSGKSQFLLELLRQLIRSEVPVFITTTKMTDWFDYLKIAREEGAGDRIVRLGLPEPSKPEPLKLDCGEFFSKTLPGGSARVLAHHLALAGDVLNNSSSGGKSSDPFFEKLIHETGLICTNLALLATGRGQLDTIHDIIMSLPASRAEVEDLTYYTRTVCGRMLELAKANRKPDQERTFRQVVEFATGKICTIGEKARGAAVQGAGAVLSGLVSDPFYSQVCTGSTWSPAMGESRRLISVIDGQPQVNFGTGQVFNFLLMAAVQAYCTSRDPASVDKPSIGIRDECAFVLTARHDARVLAGCRSLKLGFVDAIQSLPTLRMALGGSEEEADSFSALHAFKLLFSNTCNVSNDWSSKLIGDKRVIMCGGSTGDNPNADTMSRCLGATASYNWHEAFEPKVRAAEIASLPVAQAFFHADGRHHHLDFWKGKR